MNTFELSKNLFNYSIDNPDKLKPGHIAIYFFALNLANKLGWPETFGIPTDMAMAHTGIKSNNTYLNYLNELFDFGLLKIIKRSKNQWQCNIIAISKISTAHDIAHEKHMIQHTKSTQYSTDSIIKPKTIKPKTNKTINISFDVFWDLYDHKTGSKEKAKKKWESLSDSVREKIIDHLPIFKKRHPEKEFRKHPQTYLNQKVWEAEDEWNEPVSDDGRYIPGQMKGMPW